MNRGKLIALEGKETLLNRSGEADPVPCEAPPPVLPESLMAQSCLLSREEKRLTFFLSGTCAVGDILRRFHDCGLGIADLDLHKPDLEEVFLQLTSQANGTDAGRTP